MPKIIENLEYKLLEEAGKQIEQSGYGSMTIRSVASACGVGVGTVYNYFSSKDDLAAVYLLSDWKECMATIESVSRNSDVPMPVIRCIFDQLLSYYQRHKAVFQDESAAHAFTGSFTRYHGMLRAQLAGPVRKFCGSDFASEFIAESLLTWTLSEKSFDEIYGMIAKLLDVPLP